MSIVYGLRAWGLVLAEIACVYLRTLYSLLRLASCHLDMSFIASNLGSKWVSGKSFLSVLRRSTFVGLRGSQAHEEALLLILLCLMWLIMLTGKLAWHLFWNLLIIKLGNKSLQVRLLCKLQPMKEWQLNKEEKSWTTTKDELPWEDLLL